MIEPLQWRGVSVLRISNEFLSAAVLPEQGGHIGSLTDAEGHEYLCQSPDSMFRASRTGDDFEKGECAGIDDMFPNAMAWTLSEGAFAGIHLPDHGELWTLPGIPERKDDAVILTMNGSCLPYRLKKTISLRENCLRVEYDAENLGAQPFPVLWSAHPQFKAEDYKTVEIPGYEGKVRMLYCRGKEKNSGCAQYPVDQWDDGTAMDLRKIPGAEKHKAYKFMTTESLPEGKCILQGRDGRSDLEISFPKETVPYLGIWMDACSNPGCDRYVIAPEPSTHSDVSLQGCALRLEPGKNLPWWIEYKILKKGDQNAR